MTEVVSVGRPIRDTKLRIAAPDGRVLGSDAVGEVCINGPGVFAGYYHDEEATAESLIDGWYHTGDLGFLHHGELYLTGRIKDVLIVRGHNLMPDEIERLADGVTGGGGLMRSAAFSVARGAAGEEPVLVVEANTGDERPVGRNRARDQDPGRPRPRASPRRRGLRPPRTNSENNQRQDAAE